jgi:hypothetical protein
MPKLIRFLPLVILGALLAPQPSRADSIWQQTSAAWKMRDQCAQQARKVFPDYTKESNAQREKYRADCLRFNHLPVDSDPSPPAPAANQAGQPK